MDGEGQTVRGGKSISLRLSWTGIRAGGSPVGQSFSCWRREKTEYRTGHCRVDLLTPAGLRSCNQSAQNTDGRVEPAQMVRVGWTDGAEILGIHQHAHHPAQSLPNGVIGRPMDIGSCRSGPSDGAADNPPVYFFQCLIVDPQLLRDARAIVFYNHVRLFNQPVEDFF